MIDLITIPIEIEDHVHQIVLRRQHSGPVLEQVNGDCGGLSGAEELVLEEDHPNLIRKRLGIGSKIVRSCVNDPANSALLSANLIANTLTLANTLRDDKASRVRTDGDRGGSPPCIVAREERSIKRIQIRLLLLLGAIGHSLNELDQGLLTRSTASILTHNHARAGRHATSAGIRGNNISLIISLGHVGVFVKTVLYIQNGGRGFRPLETPQEVQELLAGVEISSKGYFYIIESNS